MISNSLVREEGPSVSITNYHTSINCRPIFHLIGAAKYGSNPKSLRRDDKSKNLDQKNGLTSFAAVGSFTSLKYFKIE